MDFITGTASELVKRANENRNCTKETCTASQSIYGYAPSLGVNAFFTAFFFISCGVFVFQGTRYRSWWGFTIAMSLGTICEGVGYISRIMLHNDPFSDPGFKINVVLLTFAPAFLAAGIYLLLKQLTITFSPTLSRLRPAWYTYIFISCDLVSIVLQGAGGAVSAVASTKKLLDVGENIMIAGLAFQVFTLAIFGALAGEYFFRVMKHKSEVNPRALELCKQWKFRLFLGAILLAYLCIMIRCAYRVAELSGGWGNPIMRKEVDFIVMDSVMCTIAALVFNVFHPGNCFDREHVGPETTQVETEESKYISYEESN